MDIIIDNFVLVAFAILMGILSYLWIKSGSGVSSRLPPGPKRLPLIGTIHAHGIQPTPETMKALSQKYGDIFCMYLQSKRCIVLNSYESIREALSRPWDFSHRGLSDKASWKQKGKNAMMGIFPSDYNESFIKHRKQVMMMLRNMGAGRFIMEDKILHEIKMLGEIFSTNTSSTQNIKKVLLGTNTNLTLHLLFNKRFETFETEFTDFTRLPHAILSGFLIVILIDSAPVLRHIPPFKQIVNQFAADYSNLFKFVQKHTDAILDSSKKGDRGTIVHEYIADAESSGVGGSEINRDELNYILLDLCVGGIEASTVVFEWTVLMLTNRPQIQQKLFEEIKNVVGLNREIRVSDRKNLPYVDAVILEVHRYTNITPIIPHESTSEKDVELFNFVVPKRSMILCNFQAVHMNEATWGDPTVFRPERFISEDGNFIKHPEVIAFSTGRRSCPGEFFAKQQIFLFTANLFQKFQFSPPDGKTEIDEMPVLGYSFLRPKAFELKIMKR